MCGSSLASDQTTVRTKSSAEILMLRCTFRRAVGLGTLLLLAALPRSASATTIAVGTRIPIDANTFAVPIDIIDGAAVIGWQFDLTYDATGITKDSATR